VVSQSRSGSNRATKLKNAGDTLLAECAACAEQRVMSREALASLACIPPCRSCGGDVWLWIRGGLHQYESTAPVISGAGAKRCADTGCRAILLEKSHEEPLEKS